MKSKNAWASCAALLMGFAALCGSGTAHADDWCAQGLWADAMIGSHHVHPNHDFEEFNPGLGAECYFRPEWGATAGFFRNSLRRPSFYGGVVYRPQFAHWGWFQLGVMGGVISGYNFGNWGLGSNHTIGPVLAPLIMTEFGRFGVNFILIPPIPSDDLPFTIGFQLKMKF